MILSRVLKGRPGRASRLARRRRAEPPTASPTRSGKASALVGDRPGPGRPPPLGAGRSGRRGIAGPLDQAEATRALAEALARAGQSDRAEREARGIPEPRGRAEALIAVATAVVPDAPERALALATDAERTARGIPHAGRFWALQAVARAHAAAGQVELAEQAAGDSSTERSGGDRGTGALGAGCAEAMIEPARGQCGTGPSSGPATAGITDQAPPRPGRGAGGTWPRRWPRPSRSESRRPWPPTPGGSPHGVTDADERDRASAAVVEGAGRRRAVGRRRGDRPGIADPGRPARGAGGASPAPWPRSTDAGPGPSPPRPSRTSAPGCPPSPSTRRSSWAGWPKLLAEVDRERAAALAAEAERAGNAAEGYERDDTLAAVAEAHGRGRAVGPRRAGRRGIDDARTRTEALGDLAGR